MAEDAEGPRLSEDLRSESDAVEESNARDIAKGVPPQNTPPPDFGTFNSGNFVEPDQVPMFTETETPAWAVDVNEQPFYDLYTPPGVSEAESAAPVTPGANIDFEEPYGEPNPGKGPIGTRPVKPSIPQSMRTVFEQYWRMDTKTRAEWQKRMYDAGFINEKPVAWGQPDPRGQDFKGWTEMVRTAARMNVPMDELVDQMAEAGLGAEMRGDEPVRRIPDVQLTNTADAKRMAEAISVELMGRAPTSEETNRAVARLHDLERAGGSRMQSAAASETGGGTFEGQVSAQTAIEDALEAEAPEEVAAHDQVDQFAGFLQILGGA